MKEIVIIMGTVILACLIFGMIAGDEDSLKSAGGQWFEKTIEMYQEEGR
ncbi:MAG: hypothetical protein ACI4LA_10225 [Emergencia sp.]